MVQKPALGKGLASLLPNAGVPVTRPAFLDGKEGAGAVAAGEPTTVMQQEALSNRDRHPGIALANVEEIVANTFQPRREFEEQPLEELAQSIRANGVIQPLVVRRTSQGLMLIAGERRLRAAKLAGLKQVPVVIRKSTDREALELALIENIQRQNLNCVDEALAYFQLMQEFSLTQEELALRVGKERATVANYLRLLKLPEIIIEDLRRQVLSFGHGKALLGLEDGEQRLKARAQIVERRLSVRDSEALVDSMKNGRGQPAPLAPGGSSALSPVKQRFANLAQTLTRLWSARVEFKGTEKRGKVLIHYSNRQELELLLQALQEVKK